MKQLIFIILLSFAFQGVIQAQPGERVKQLKIAFLTEKLNLSVQEGQMFWPLYNEHEDNRDVLEKKIRQDYRKIKDSENQLSEKDLILKLDQITKSRIEMAEMDAEFLKSCLPVLGAEKCSKLVSAEEEFKKEIMRELRDRRHEGRQ